ncbi:MAG: hypothetical protein R6X02_09115 [Enhygromyxa sp.]
MNEAIETEPEVVEAELLELEAVEPEAAESKDQVGVPEPIDEGAVTRALTVEDVTTHEYPAASETAGIEPDAVEPSETIELADEVIERLVPVGEPGLEPGLEEPITIEYERAPETVAVPQPLAHRPSTMVGLIRPNGAVILLGLLCALALVETIGAFLAYRERVVEQDWQAIDQLLAGHEGEPLIVASEWLGPSARMHLGRARSWDSVAFPDLRGYPRFWLLSHAAERPWTGPLRAELEQLPRPQLLAVHRVGELMLHEYQQEVGALRFSLLDAIESVSTARGRCSGAGAEYRCKEGRVGVRVLEVDYRPRRCLALELDDGVMATIDLGERELGDRIYGHVGFGDFNARLRSDPSARVELRINDVIAGRWVFSDDQGWAAFALATVPGRHRVELRIGTTVGGTWQRGKHESSPTNSLCVELRGFDESTLRGSEEDA